MEKWIWFSVLSLLLIAVSLKSFMKPGSHGFYRFFGWECMLWLLLNNYSFWFKDPLSPAQLFSWCLLLLSIYPAVTGIVMLIKHGKVSKARNDKNLYGFESTTELVDTGIYKYIRHPLYLSLILLTWGIFFKNIKFDLLVVSTVTSILLFLTARADEKECIAYFGDKYKEYKKRSKMFIPYIF
jgi:protein-S-isoprenylcysteine O-methyltransferase Ste14